MNLLTKTNLDQFAANGRTNQALMEAGKDTIDHAPVVKLFTPDAGATWLLSETDPDDPDIAFGLCDLGLGCPELGSVSLTELKALRGKFGLPVERYLYFVSDIPISVHADQARTAGGSSPEQSRSAISFR